MDQGVSFHYRDPILGARALAHGENFGGGFGPRTLARPCRNMGLMRGPCQNVEREGSGYDQNGNLLTWRILGVGICGCENETKLTPLNFLA